MGANAADLGGCFSLSNPITVVRFEGADCANICTANGGMISTDDPTEICAGNDSPDPINVTLTGNSGTNSAWVITDEDLNILALPTGPPFDLDGAGAGTCLIWHISFEDGLTGAMMNANAADLDGCFGLSNPITVIRNGVNGGAISTDDPTEICAGDGIPDPINVTLTGEEGMNSAWVISDLSGTILALPTGPPFDLEGEGPGICVITHVSYEDGLEGLAVDNNIFGSLSGCFSLSNDIAVTRLTGTDCSDGVNRAIGDDAISISAVYPVPATSEISIVVESKEEFVTTVQIFDLSGKPIIQDQRQVAEGINKFEFDVSNLPDGMFYIAVPNSKGKFTTKRFVKMHN